MIDKTYLEKKAIASARRPLAETLKELGILDRFNDLTPEQIDRIIETVWDGCRVSMEKSAILDDEIPF